jgi:hypothetical protein
MRCLADLAFMLGQYDFAVANYRLAAQDYLAAPNSKWYAGAEVRAAARTLRLAKGCALMHSFTCNFRARLCQFSTATCTARKQCEHHTAASSPCSLLTECCVHPVPSVRLAGDDRCVLHPDSRCVC